MGLAAAATVEEAGVEFEAPRPPPPPLQYGGDGFARRRPPPAQRAAGEPEEVCDTDKLVHRIGLWSMLPGPHCLLGPFSFSAVASNR